MATLMQAVERARNDGTLPSTGPVSARDLINRFPPWFQGSLRSVQDEMFKGAEKKPWAIILCRFQNEPADPARENPIEQFYRGAFTKGTGGLVEFWRDASLGKIDIDGSRVFGWVQVNLTRANAGVGSGQNRSTLVDAAIAAVQAAGMDPITGFHSQLSVYIENWTMNGAPPGADWSHPTWGQNWIDGSADGRGKVSLTPPHNGNIVAHEMGHSFGMDHDLGSNLTDHYMDPCCIMSQNNAFIQQPWGLPFGPAICVTHLALKGWMYPRRLYVDTDGWMSEPDGMSVPLAALTDPAARANLGIRFPLRRPGMSWDYYVQYVRPEGWDRGIAQPLVFVRRSAPFGSTQSSAILGSLLVPSNPGDTAEFVEPSGNVRFSVQLFDNAGRILRVTAKAL